MSLKSGVVRIGYCSRFHCGQRCRIERFRYMAEHRLSTRSLPEHSEAGTTGRTFAIAMWAIGFLFAFQLGMVTWGILRRDASDFATVEPLRVPRTAVPEAGRVVPFPAGTGVRPRATTTDSDPGGGESSSGPGADSAVVGETPADAGPVGAEGPGVTDLDRLAGELVQAARDSEPIPNTILERLVATGEELFSAGNFQGALQALNKAETGLPDHPRVLSGLAATYQQMGVRARAGDYWKQVFAMGAGTAGPYFGIADRQLNGGEDSAEASAVETPDGSDASTPILYDAADEASGPAARAPAAGEESRAVLSIGEIKVDEQPPGDAGQRVSLRIVVDALDGRRHAGEDLDLFVFFYDLVDDERILESTADTSYFYPTEPYDWDVNGREEIVVQYNQPKFTPDQERDLGSREYYGYAIQLYYRDELQDTVEMPSEIARLRPEPTRRTLPPGAGSGPERVGPENALFPSTSE